jgi:hypothetical protein
MDFSHNIPDVDRQLASLRERLPEAFKHALKISSNQMLSWVKQDFEKKAKGNEVSGISWNPISREGARARLRKLGSYQKLDKAGKSKAIDGVLSQHSIGIDTGRLRNSFSIGNPENINEVTTDFIRIGTKISYAEYYDEKRPIFGDGFLDSSRQNRVEQIIHKAGEEHLKQIPFEG